MPCLIHDDDDDDDETNPSGWGKKRLKKTNDAIMCVYVAIRVAP